MSVKKIYYVFYGRFPSEKAHALYVAKNCESLAEIDNVKVTVVVPRRYGRTKENAQDFFSIKDNFEVTYLPILDLNYLPLPPKFRFYVSSFSFSISVFFYFLFKFKKNIYIFSADYLPLIFLTPVSKKLIYEVHDYPNSAHTFFKFLFNKISFVITQNVWKKDKLIKEFNIAERKILVEPNAVTLADFDVPLTKDEAREKLGLPKDRFIAMYTGHLFGWKGAHELAKAAECVADNVDIIFVGGKKEDEIKFKEKFDKYKNIHIKGFKKHQEIPIWQKAADCLILPNTVKEDISKYYTSPMKLFEYMASQRPIIASDIPSIRSVVSDESVYFVEPDNPQAICMAIKDIQNNSDMGAGLVVKAYDSVQFFTWHKRAERVFYFLLK